MNVRTRLFSFFDSTPESILYDHLQPFDKVKFHLSELGMTPAEVKVFIYLGYYGPKTAIEIASKLKITSTETNDVLSSLQRMGIVSLR